MFVASRMAPKAAMAAWSRTRAEKEGLGMGWSRALSDKWLSRRRPAGAAPHSETCIRATAHQPTS